MGEKPAAFIDRDGVIIREVNYLNRLEDLEIYPNAVEAVRLLNKKGFHVILVTNQSGVARGYLSIQKLEEIHAAIIQSMKRHNAFIDGIYFCPHHPEFGPPHLKIQCNCRKPRTGMIDKALEDFSVDIDHSFVMGDQWRDMQMAFNAGLFGVMVRTGQGRDELRRCLPDFTLRMKGFHMANHALDGVRWVLKRFYKDSPNQPCIS